VKGEELKYGEYGCPLVSVTQVMLTISILFVEEAHIKKFISDKLFNTIIPILSIKGDFSS
jgi:hypothetical protein